MRLLRLHLRDFGGVRSRTVELQPQGVTVLVGPNEVGKSTLLAALDILIRLPDSSRAQEVRDAQPAGQDVGPRVEAEMATGPYRLTYAKQWLKSPQTTLRVAGPGLNQALTGREAHERAEAIFAETLDRDLWDALRVQQGQLIQGQGSATPLARSGSLREALDRAAGGNLGGRAEYGLLERVAAERAQYLTDTGHPRGAYRDAARRVDEARAAVSPLRTRMSDVERLLTEIPRLEGELRRIGGDRVRAAERLTELQARQDAVRAQAAELARREADVANADRHQAAVAAALAQRQALARGVAQAEEHLAALRLRAESAPDVGGLQAHRAAAHEAWLARRAEAEAATARRAQAQMDLDRVRDRAALEALDLRLERAHEAEARLHAAEALQATATLTPEALRRLEEAQGRADRAAAQLEVGSASLEIAALADVDLRIGPDARHLAAGASETHNVPDSLELLLPGLLSIRVRGGGEAARLKLAAETAHDELRRLLAEAGVASLPAARAAADARRSAEETARRARGDLQSALAGHSLDDLAAERARLAARASAPPPSLDLAQAEAARAQAEAAEQQALLGLDRARQHEEAAMSAAQAAELQVAGLRREIQLAEEGHATASETLARARMEEGDDPIAAAAATAAEALRLAQSAHQAARAAYDSLDPDQVRLLWSNQTKVVAGLDGQRWEAESQLVRTQERLRMMEGEGLQEACEEAERDLERAEREHGRLRRLAEAADLLHRTLRAHRERMLRDYQAPYREAIEGLGRVVFGPTFAVELDEDLDVARRTLAGQTLDFRLLSTGAQEQLAVLARLAAATLASGDGVPVILDDAFGYSDPSRLEMLGAVLASVGDRCQILALTCFPERYQGGGGAKVIRIGPEVDAGMDLEASVRQVAAAAEPRPMSTAAPSPADRVLACLEAAAQPLGKRELLAAAGLPEAEWARIMDELLRGGRVERLGAKRGATYRVRGM